MPNVRIDGTAELVRVAKSLKAMGETVLIREMRKGMRGLALPLVAEVKAAAATHSQNVAQTIVLETRFAGRSAGVNIKAKASKMPKGKEALPGLLEAGSQGSAGRYIRHPVFARKGASVFTGRASYRATGRTRGGLRGAYDRRNVKWVNQPTHPFLEPVIAPQANRLQEQIADIIEAAARQAGITA